MNITVMRGVEWMCFRLHKMAPKKTGKQKQLATVTVYDRMVITIIMENENYLGKWKMALMERGVVNFM